jgi:hypothetical protein
LAFALDPVVAARQPIVCISGVINSVLTLAFGAADMVAALRLLASVLTAATSDTSALKVLLVSSGLPAAAVSVGLQLTGVKAKAWCLLIHAEASLSQGPGRKPGACLYTRKRLSHRAQGESLVPPHTRGSVCASSHNSPLRVVMSPCNVCLTPRRGGGGAEG